MANATQIVLIPNTIHCVKTGIAIVTLIGDGRAAVDTVNALLTSGKFEAGNHPGHIKLTEGERAVVEAKHEAKLPRHGWISRDKATGEWRQRPGWAIGEHNEAVLAAFGFNADPTTLSKGQVSRRQYGVFAAKEPKVAKQSKANVAASIVYGSEGTVPAVVAEPVITLPEGANAMDLLPTEAELTGTQGCYPRYIGRVCKLGMNRSEATKAWNDGKTALMDRKQAAMDNNPAVIADRVMLKQALENLVEAPKPTAPKAPIVAASGSTIRVTPEALQAVLAALQGATIGGFDGKAFTVTY